MPIKHNRWDGLEELIKKCLTRKQLCQKCNNPNDIDNYFKDFLRFDGYEQADPEERLKYFLSHENLLKAARVLNIPKKEREDIEKDELIRKVIEILGFEVKPPPEGITQLVEKIEKSEEEVKNNINNEFLIKGHLVESFKLLEKVFQEFFYIYTQWRFSEESSETIFSLWIKNKNNQKNLNNKRNPMLGQFRNILLEIDKEIQNNENEKKHFDNNFGRPYLIFPVDDNIFKITLPDEPDYTQLKITIDGRNSLIHYSDKDIDVLELIKKLHDLIKYFSTENIFPFTVVMRYRIEYEDGTIRAFLLNEQNKIYSTQSGAKSLTFNTKYYDLGFRSKPRFIQYNENWKEALKKV